MRCRAVTCEMVVATFASKPPVWIEFSLPLLEALTVVIAILWTMRRHLLALICRFLVR